MLTKSEIFETIYKNRIAIRNLGINEVGLFGSYVRNEQNKNSDIDILIDYEKGNISFSNYMKFCFLMEEEFKDTKVEIVTKNGLSKYIGPYILKEVEYAKI